MPKARVPEHPPTLGASSRKSAGRPSVCQVSVRNESGLVCRTSSLRLALETLLNRPVRLDVLLTTDEGMRALNRQYRGIDAPTDVLSFEGPGWVGAPLGDIAISVPFAKAGAAKRRVAVGNELAFLALHGCLHLLGYDDADEHGRQEMVRRANETMVQIGLEPDAEWASQPHTGERG